jgi:hypothetical protein
MTISRASQRAFCRARIVERALMRDRSKAADSRSRRVVEEHQQEQRGRNHDGDAAHIVACTIARSALSAKKEQHVDENHGGGDEEDDPDPGPAPLPSALVDAICARSPGRIADRTTWR